MTKRLDLESGRKYVGAVELADEAARLVGRFVPRQERGSVSELPDERMVRYYSSGGLISPPEGRQGTAAVYGYLHLLQLLAIKRLQAEHLPIKKIKELVEGKTETDLEQLLEVGERAQRPEKGGNAAREYLESLLAPGARGPARSSRQSLSLQAEAPVLQVRDSTSHYSAAPPSSDWTRIVVDEGLELHIRGDYRLAEVLKDRQRLARRMVNEIERRIKHS